MRLILQVLSITPILTLGYWAVQMQTHQDEFTSAFIDRLEKPNAQGKFIDPLEDPVVREKFRKVCGDVVVGTTMLGSPDASCVRTLQNYQR